MATSGTAFVLFGMTGSSLSYLMWMPGMMKSKGDTDLRILMPPQPAVATAVNMSTKKYFVVILPATIHSGLLFNFSHAAVGAYA